MPLTPEQQIYNSIEKAKNILIIFNPDSNTDGLASALSLGAIFKKLEKKYHITAHNFTPIAKLSFLPYISEIQGTIPALKKFIISLNVSKTQVRELNYDVQGQQLKIFITPKNGLFTPEDLALENSSFIFDLIFVLNSQGLETLGEPYENNTEFFYETPIINIDYHPDNEYFGQINLINLTATSTSEIVYSLIESLDKNLIDEDIATLLLTGIISKTKNFKSLEITPQTLVTTSKLIALGGRREEIITNLYRTKAITDLKLWGRVLARLESSSIKPEIIWSALTLRDFEKSGASKESLPEVMDELIASIPETEIVILLYEETTGDVSVIISSYNKNLDVLKLAKEFNPQGAKDKARFQIKEKPIIEAGKELIAKIEEKLKIPWITRHFFMIHDSCITTRTAQNPTQNKDLKQRFLY